jgi:hypothetical protein
MENLLLHAATTQGAQISDTREIRRTALPKPNGRTNALSTNGERKSSQIEESRLVDKILEKPSREKSKTPVSN